jgi:glycine cleavage system regulatory protein
MQASLVMTVIGADRPGLVDSVAQLVADHGGNWLESRMSRLGGQFAGILRVSVPTGQQAQLTAALRELEGRGLRVVVHDDVSAAPPAGDLRVLEVVGHDRPGIVRQIARVLAARGVNVEELSSAVASAPMSGEPLFRAHATLRLPAGCAPESLQQALEQIAADLIVEISLAKPGGAS